MSSEGWRNCGKKKKNLIIWEDARSLLDQKVALVHLVACKFASIKDYLHRLKCCPCICIGSLKKGEGDSNFTKDNSIIPVEGWGLEAVNVTIPIQLPEEETSVCFPAETLSVIMPYVVVCEKHPQTLWNKRKKTNKRKNTLANEKERHRNTLKLKVHTKT